ncbi:peptide deformylase [Candidatus Vidania fulgoroideorum]
MLLVNNKLLNFYCNIFFKNNNLNKNFYKKLCYFNNGLALNFSQICKRFNFFILEKFIFYYFYNNYYLFKSSEKYILIEGCLSLNKNFIKIRSKYLSFISYNKNFIKRKIFIKGFYSICIQHEIDHSIGILINKG